MARKTFRTVPFKRKRQKATDYKTRRTLLLSGKTRLVVRKSNAHVIAQLVDYRHKGDAVIKAAHSKDLTTYGWKGPTGNVAAAYLTGYLLGMRAKDAVSEAVLDIGMYTSVKGSRVYAVAKGFRDAGMNLPASEDILPDEERCLGKHIEEYSKSLKENDEDTFKKKFSKVLEAGVDPTTLSEHVSATKDKITNDAK